MENKILATVGGRTVTTAAVDYVIKSLDPQSQQYFGSEAGRKQVLSDLVNQELYYLDALENHLDEEEEYLKAVDDFKISILKQYAINKLMRTIEITEQEAKDYYEANKNRFIQPEQVRASHILVKTEGDRDQVAKALQDGMSFEDAAVEYSTCPSNMKGGDLGTFGHGAMVQEFEDAVFAMDTIGVVSDPVKTQFGYHFIKLTDKLPSKTKSFEEAADEIRHILLGKKQQEVYLAKAEQLKEKFPVMMVEK